MPFYVLLVIISHIRVELFYHLIFSDVYKQTKIKERPKKATQLPKTKFNVIYVDPPWSFTNKPLTGLVEKEYLTMKLDNIFKLRVPSADDLVLKKIV